MVNAKLAEAAPRTGCGPVRPSTRSKWRALALVLVHVVVLVHVAHWKRTGTTLTPVEPSESMQTLEQGYLNAGFLLFAAAILLTLVLGRFFCGWACHVVAYQDLCAWILKKLRLRPQPLRSRLLVFVPLGAAFYMFAWPQVVRMMEQRAMPPWVPRFATQDLWQTFPGPWMAALTILVDGFLVVWFLGAKGFCTYGCPYGAIFGLADRAAPVRIRVTDACEGCGHCTATCTSNVRVHEEVALHRMVVDPGCMKCLDCVSVCPKEALYVGFGAPALSTKPARAARYDLAWPEEIAAALAFCFGLFVFRDLYHAVPFLLAIGISVLLAVVAIALWRLARRRELRFQHATLKRGGRLTAAGWTFAALGLAFVAFAVASAPQQWHLREGERLFQAARRARGAERQAAMRDSRAELESAARFSLVPMATLQVAIASTAQQLGDAAAADAHARRALEIDPDLSAARLILSDLRMAEGKREEAEQELLRLLERDPDHAEARRRLGR